MGRSTDSFSEISIDNQSIQLTNITKVLWEKKGIRKIDYLNYLTRVSAFMLPFLSNRLLTTIRFPDGINQEKFYQKNCPDYAPSFIPTYREEDINYILCNNQATLLWLGNQSAVEFHVPFTTIQSKKPAEIVFDLDPPSRTDFHLAVEAALLLKQAFDQLNLQSYVKTSGNKGLQIYIPLPPDTFTFDETRIFTNFVAHYLVEKEPNWFTTERLKAKRGKKLYVDYVQHAEGKTIIAPYSLRGNEEALVATPLEWSEVNSNLHPEQFPLEGIEQRIKDRGCPFQNNYFTSPQNESFKVVIEHLRLTIR